MTEEEKVICINQIIDDLEIKAEERIKTDFDESLSRITLERMRMSARFEWYYKLLREMYDEWKQNRLEIVHQSNQ